MENEKFFYELLDETGKVFRSSPVEKYQIENSKNWNYSVCETPIIKNTGLIFGLNWGGDDIDAQSVYPEADKERKWNFMSNSSAYFKKYLGITDIKQVNYSNLCFFRSPNVKYLKTADWDLALPLFKKYVEFIEPTWAVLLGKKGVSILKRNGHLTNLERIVVKGEKRRSFGYKGILFNKYPFFCVPHPQAHISSEVRDSLWNQLFPNKI